MAQPRLQCLAPPGQPEGAGWAGRLFPPDHKTQLLRDFEDGNLRVDPLEIGKGWRIVNIVVSVHVPRILL